ncbi:energy-coupling factor transport system permease protein [Nocardiopsis flavescens]|uniref:Energy-coupling factor transport system permease protein n=1 Tax=Nocardiopsis flavescens TaxID=758803 RepID=A0A1M6IHP3_9ACTN|nr:CbiQ family ECF transporter T component [Nocardiopsis flavescens]SHJ33965.1 energy-coupling factor transport system permease protein [Nocardiopsis flavescens]
MRNPATARTLPRALHPGAWWLWALGLAAAVSQSSNPLIAVLAVCAAGTVVARRRTDAPWALAFRLYLLVGVLIIVSRVVFRVIFGGGQGDIVLFTLPRIPLPETAGGIRLLGPVALEQLLGGLYDGLRLAAVVACVGAANALADPKRLLKSVPGALYEVGTSVVVAMTVAPQLVESVRRVRRARRLRAGRRRGVRALRGIVIPVLEDALDRSLALAAAMASHGYGRVGAVAPRTRLFTGLLVIGGLIGVCVGLYGLMDSSTSPHMGTWGIAVGLALATAGFVLGGRRVRRTRYRPAAWRGAEFLTAGAGAAAVVFMQLASRYEAAALYPSLNPLAWPELTLLPFLALVAAASPAWLTPPPLSVLDPDRALRPLVGEPERVRPVRPVRRTAEPNPEDT